MLALAVKLLFAPVFVIGTYLIQRRFGARWGGISMAVPFILAPILIAIYIEQGSDFLYSSIVGSYAGQIALLFFIATYTRMAPRFNWSICIVSATSVFLISVAVLSPLINELWVGIALWIIMTTFNHYRFGPNSSTALMHGLLQYLPATSLLILPLAALLI